MITTREISTKKQDAGEFADRQPYFQSHAPDVHLSAPQGLRRGQQAAIYALVGHLTLTSEPAIAVLPTGAGKTDVAILLPYILRATRVLFVAPSDAVRSQTVERFGALSLLKKIGVLDSKLPPPRIKKLSHRIGSLEEWDALRAYDIVVTTPSSISPILQGVLNPPEDLFDLLIIDEAHHSPAKTWQAVLAAFPNAQRALFTATPFRRDRKHIKGTIVVNYALRDARKDRVFGDIHYRPVAPKPDEDTDTAIARAAEKALAKDRKDGYAHSILVRADSIPHAEALARKYKKATKLKLEVVHSHFTAKRVDATIQSLRKGDLDGVICVNMLGEGFDFPNLKIAALHAPHASLGVTLQFIGRFARVGNEKIGAAQFFAVPTEIEGELESLFEDESVWQDLIVNLADHRNLFENQLRTAVATFAPPAIQEHDIEELSLYALRPLYHVKVYRVPEDLAIDISQPIILPPPFEIVHRQASSELSTAVIVAREQQRPRWSDQGRFGRIEYELFVIHYDAGNRFLFITASRRADSLYRQIATEYIGHTPKGLPLYMVNRTLAGLHDIECFSVGMKNRLHAARQESYRIVAGRSAQQAIRITDGRLFHQGHVFCTALDGEGTSVVLGYSSGSKIWSSGKGTVPELVAWCDELADKMNSSTGKITAPGLDLLEVGEPLKQLPTDVFAADWDSVVYEDFVQVAGDGADDEKLLLAEFSLSVDHEHSSASRTPVRMEHDTREWLVEFRPDQKAFFTLVEGGSFDVIYDDDRMPIVDFLNEYPLYFYCASFAKFRGEENFPCRISLDTFDRERIENTINWKGGRVNIQKEFWKPGEAHKGKLSIHDYLKKRLNVPGNQIVLYDHRSGEIADFLTVSADSAKVTATLYHCKPCGGKKPGDRLEDAYEVCGQVVKSFQLICDDSRVIRHVKRRTTTGKIRSQFIRGTLPELENLLCHRGSKQLCYRFVVVQPGISKSGTGPEGLSLLAAANEFIHRLGAEDLSVLGSE